MKPPSEREENVFQYIAAWRMSSSSSTVDRHSRYRRFSRSMVWYGSNSSCEDGQTTKNAGMWNEAKRKGGQGVRRTVSVGKGQGEPDGKNTKEARRREPDLVES
eukprot:6192565-Pleurochrysis_carterae.AAC.1